MTETTEMVGSDGNDREMKETRGGGEEEGSVRATCVCDLRLRCDYRKVATNVRLAIANCDEGTRQGNPKLILLEIHT